MAERSVRDVGGARVVVRVLSVRNPQPATLINDRRPIALDLERGPQASFVGLGDIVDLHPACGLREGQRQTGVEAMHSEDPVFKASKGGRLAVRATDEPVE